MSKLVFHIQGSSPEPYTVIIERNGNNLRATCDCQAGQMKQYCKHRFGIFEGSAAGLMGGNIERLGEVRRLLEGTDVQAAIATVKQAEQDEDAAKKRLQNAKRALAQAMSD